MGILHKSTAVFGLLILACSVAHAEDWQLKKEAEGIKVSLKEYPGSAYKAYQGVTVMKTSIAKLRSLQEDIAGSCAWIYSCKSQKVLKSGASEVWVYSTFDTPAMVSSRDAIIHATSSEGADGSVTRKLVGESSYLPEQKGFVRVTQLEGSWRFVPKGEGLVEVTYQMHSEPGGSVPSWLANSFVVDAPFNTLKSLRERAEK